MTKNIDITQSKTQRSRQQLRTKIRQRRRFLSPQAQSQAAKLLTKRLITLDKVNKANNIALYLSNDGELDTMPFIHWCWQHNKNIYLPVIHPFSHGQLLFLKYTKNTKMITNKYGIKEPKLDIRQLCLLSKLDILFTPLVAFDLSGNRLGMGGGFYDRTLAAWYKDNLSHKLSPKDSKRKTPCFNSSRLYPIGLAHDCQQIDKIENELWDIPLPQIITPTKTFKFTKI